MNEILQSLWAKSDPHHPLWCHLLDAAAVARALVPRFGEIEGLPPGWIEFLVGAHDVGKADDWFQNKDPQRAAQVRNFIPQLPEWKITEYDERKKFRHEVRSQKWLQEWLLRTSGWNKDAANVAAKAIVGHHGDWAPKNWYAEEKNPIWPSLRDELGAMLWDVLQPQAIALEKFPHAAAAGAKLSAYVIFSDWIASNDKLFPFEGLPKHQSPREYFAASCELARDVVRQLKLEAPPHKPQGKPLLHDVWPPEKFDHMKAPRPLQSELEERRDNLWPGLAIIEAPTGEGKTEAAIYLAQLWNWLSAGRGTYFALPTQATSNAMFTRYAAFLEEWKGQDVRARLLHGMAWMNDETQPDKDELELLPQIDAPEEKERALKQAFAARDWFRPTRRALLSEEGVGTVDQALLCALRVKFGTLRLLGLSQKTLIVDEVHAYDEFMSALLVRLLQWCRALDINVIFLSATLAYEQKMTLARAYAGADADLSPLEINDPKTAPYPLLTFVPREGLPFNFAVDADASRARTLKIELKDGLLEDFAATALLAAQTVSNGGCLCVLANTVRAAQEIFRELQKLKDKKQLPADCNLDLFHARFRAAARQEIEDDVVKKFGPAASKNSTPPRPPCAILVATQVVEQSLDVDFDFFLSQIAPIDLLLQRAGRLWRHARENRPCEFPTLTIMTPPENDWNFGATGKVYEPEILLRTLAILHEKAPDECVWDLPKDFRPLVEKCYRRDEDLGAFATRDGFAEELADGVEKRDKEREESTSEAQKHLWISPSPKSFQPVARTQDEPDEEGSGQAQKYFVARTRLGDDSVSLLAISDAALLQKAHADKENAALPRDQQKTPSRKELKNLFGCKVGVPRWWLFDKSGAMPCEGFAPFWEGETFLRGQIVLPLRDINGENVWHGQTAKGRFAIVDDPQLGLCYRALDADTAVQSTTEADAGQML